MSTKNWDELADELGRWRAARRCATLWCRDDDAFECTPALDRLVSLSEARNVPVALAVIPTLAAEALAAWLEGRTSVSVVVHGYAHISHAPADEKRAEFGAHRAVEEMLAEVRLGLQRIEGLFGRRSRPVFVPPWNRLSDALRDRLPSAGFGGLSTYQSRHAAVPTTGLRQTNCHVDVIDWKVTRGFVGETTALGLLTHHLRSRRLNVVDADEPTGVLTHHKDHDEACWSFLEKLWDFTADSGAATWLDVSGAMWPN